MQVLVKKYAWLQSGFLPLMLFFFIAGCHKGPHTPTVTTTTVATGLTVPMGIEVDARGNIWVAESGTAHNDGKVVLIKPNGTKYDAIVHLSSISNEASGETEGPAHLLFDHGTLYILSGNYLYKANVSGFKPGDASIEASTLSYEDIGAFVINYPFKSDPKDTHPYNLIKGFDGDIYITDAGANAIIHRKSAGNYSVLAELPGVANPTHIGPPQVQCVPTGIIFDGRNFLVTTLTGFPFPAGQALIYKVSLSGNVSVYQKGFTTLVDIADGNIYGHLALHYGTINTTSFSFNNGTGQLIFTNGASSAVLVDALNMPVGIKQVNARTWYITCMGDGTVVKVTYD